ncbi:hypothetical protein ACFQNE_06410 [Gordonia phosphorivorans]|uniref:Uncharacterized protein n=1 Tax=Gordonia phosphorivorans TaxID=1056982 RepID=A0ABV6H7A1_9ACTN
MGVTGVRWADLLTPEPLMRLARGVADDDQALRINANSSRRAYLDRLAAQTRAHADTESQTGR